MATGSDSTHSTPMQETGDPSEHLLRKLLSALADIKEKLDEYPRNPKERADRKDKTRLTASGEKVVNWIKIARKKQENRARPPAPSVPGRDDDDNEVVPHDWEQQIYRPPLRGEMKSRTATSPKLKIPANLQPDRYPNKLMINRARVLVLTMRYQFRKEKTVPMERSAHDYTAVRRLIEQFGYEDTLEYILMNTIILEELQFENVTYERTEQVMVDNGFDCKVPDIKHLNFFLETYRQLSSSLATKYFKDELYRMCKDNDLPAILKDVYWTCEEMQLMLKLLVDDRRNNKDVNALIVFISMHGGLQGGKTVIYDCESKHVDINQVLQKFAVSSIQNNDNLCGLLFLSVCRGDKENESEAVNLFVGDSGNEVVGVNADQGGSGDMISKYILNLKPSEVIVDQGIREDTTSEGLENTGRAGVDVDQECSGDTTSKGLRNTGCARANVDQGCSGDKTSKSLQNTGCTGAYVDQGGSGDTTNKDKENIDRAGVKADQGGKEETTSTGLKNTNRAEVNMDQGGGRDRISEGQENTCHNEVNTCDGRLPVAVAESWFHVGFSSMFDTKDIDLKPATQPEGLQLQVEGSNGGSLSDSFNDIQMERNFLGTGRSDDSTARIQAESFPVPIIGPVHSSPSEEEVVQEDMATEHLLPETAGSCPNNCLVAYAATKGFKTGGYDHSGTLYIQKIVDNITQYESVALLPFLTLLHKDLAVHLEMPTFDHRLTKMPVLRRREKETVIQSLSKHPDF